MTADEVKEYIIKETGDEEIIVFDEFAEAFLGLSQSAGSPSRATYNREKCIKILEENWKDVEAEDLNGVATEYFEFNTLGSHLGERTPLFLTTIKPL